MSEGIKSKKKLEAAIKDVNRSTSRVKGLSEKAVQEIERLEKELVECRTELESIFVRQTRVVPTEVYSFVSERLHGKSNPLLLASLDNTLIVKTEKLLGSRKEADIARIDSMKEFVVKVKDPNFKSRMAKKGIKTAKDYMDWIEKTVQEGRKKKKGGSKGKKKKDEK